MQCNDDKSYFTETVRVNTGDNYVYVYCKDQSSSTFETSPNIDHTQTERCTNCKKEFSNLEKHYERVLICRQSLSMTSKCSIRKQLDDRKKKQNNMEKIEF